MRKCWRGSLGVAFGIAVIVAGLGLAIVVYSPVSAQLTGAATTELQQLQARLRALGADPPEAELKKVTDALDGWARKYRAQTMKQERARPGQSFSRCLPTVDGPPGYYCYYSSSDKGKCYYTCVKL